MSWSLLSDCQHGVNMASLSWVTLQEFSLVPQSHRSMQLTFFKGGGGLLPLWRSELSGTMNSGILGNSAFTVVEVRLFSSL